MAKVFLGGTTPSSDPLYGWRGDLIPMLKIDYFNPVVDDWTPECMEEEIRQREICDICLYVITPEMTGVYSIAEAVDDSNKRPSMTVFCVLNDGTGFSDGQMRSLAWVGQMVKRNRAQFFTSLDEVANYLNTEAM